MALAPPLTLVVRVLRPAIALLNSVANRALRAIGVQPKNEITSAFTRDEVAGLVDESRREGLLDPHEARLLARTVLLPLGRLATVDVGVTPEQLEQARGAHRLLTPPRPSR